MIICVVASRSLSVYREVLIIGSWSLVNPSTFSWLHVLKIQPLTTQPCMAEYAPGSLQRHLPLELPYSSPVFQHSYLRL